jgi:hypothetical protein
MGKSGISIGVINNLMIKVPGRKIIASNLGHFDLGRENWGRWLPDR